MIFTAIPAPVATPLPPVKAAAESAVVRPLPAALPSVAPGERAARVASFLTGRPLADHAAMLVRVADEVGIDWRILPAMAIRESGGGAQACGFNFTGYGNCDGRWASEFPSWEACARASAELFARLGGREDWRWTLRVWQAGDRGAAAGGGAWYADEVEALILRE